MEEIIKSILFIIFGFIGIVGIHLAIKIYTYPCWKYKELQEVKRVGLAINIETNQWV